MKKKEIKDHFGHTFRSLTSLAHAYNIEPERLRKRILNGWDIRRALTTPIIESQFNKPIQDHKGKTFKNARDMCLFYNVPYNRFISRLTIRHWDLERCLSSEKYSGAFIPAKDHLGNTYSSLSAMARAWGIAPNCFLTRYDAGWSIERALTTPVKDAKKYKKLKLKPEYDSGLEEE